MLGWDHTIAYPSGHQQMSAYASLVWDLNSELLTKAVMFKALFRLVRTLLLHTNRIDI